MEPNAQLKDYKLASRNNLTRKYQINGLFRRITSLQRREENRKQYSDIHFTPKRKT